MLSPRQHDQKVRDAIARWANSLGLDPAAAASVAQAVYAQRRELVDLLQGGAGQPAFEPSTRSEKTLGKYTGAKP